MNEWLTVCIPLIGTAIGSIAGIITSARMTTYKIEQIEKKIDDYATVKERIAILEKEDATQWKRIDELKNDLNKVKEVIK